MIKIRYCYGTAQGNYPRLRVGYEDDNYDFELIFESIEALYEYVNVRGLVTDDQIPIHHISYEDFAIMALECN